MLGYKLISPVNVNKNHNQEFGLEKPDLSPIELRRNQLLNQSNFG
jgi:hypothetical protein